MEEAMKLDWTITELMHLTRNELCELAKQIEDGLSDLEARSALRHNALTSLENIRRVMALRKLRS
jgi:hypothetical protein